MSNKLIDIVNVTKSFDESVILDHLNLYIRENEFLTLLGGLAAARPHCFGFWVVSRLRIPEISFLTGRTSTSCRPTDGSSILCSRNMRSLPI